MPTSNEKATDELAWQRTDPSYRDGLEQVVETWRADGTLTDLRSS